MSKERGLNFGEEIDKMDKNNRLLSVIKAFSELDLDPRTIDNVKMGYIFEELIRKFSENAEAGDHYTDATSSSSWLTFCWPRAAMIFSMMVRLSPYWIKPVAQAVCFPLAITSSSVIIRLRMFVCSVRKSIQSLTLCALRNAHQRSEC